MEEKSHLETGRGITPWLLVLAASYISTPLWDPDLWWHITVGRWIIANKQFPYVDYWTIFGYQLPWVAYSWLPEVVFAATDRVLALEGLAVLKLLSAIGLSFSFFFSFFTISGDRRMALLLAVFSTFAIFNHFALRPQVYTWALFALLLSGADLATRDKDSKVAALTIIFCATLFWANSHLTTIIALCGVASWSFGLRQLRAFLFCSAAVLVASFGTPYGGHEWVVLFEKFLHPLEHRTISEFRPASILYYQTAFLLIIALTTAVFTAVRAKIGDVVKVLSCLVLFIGAWSVNKFSPYAIVYLCAFISYLWRRANTKNLSSKFEIAFEKLFVTLGRIPSLVAALLCLALSAANISHSLSHGVKLGYVPVAAVDFIIEHDLPAPILNEFAEGGYLMYRLGDHNGNLENRVAIDGRTNVTPQPIIDEYFSALRNDENWENFFLSVKPKTVLWRRMNPLTNRLLASPDWCAVFVNHTHAVFVARTEATRMLKNGEINECISLSK